MGYLAPTDYEGASDEVRREYDYWTARAGRVTNMKRLMLRNMPTYRTYMEWYTLYDCLAEFIDKRAIDLLCYAVSTNNHCLLCSSYFQQIFVDADDDPEDFVLDETEQLLFDLGAAVSSDPNAVPDDVYERLNARFTPDEIVLIIGFAAQMVATNYFNMVAKVDVDEVLEPYMTPEFLAKVGAEA
ncbi:MAG: hypothetical protein LBH56_01135 [Coriobacteriales bacterium]|jgi:alkylhydroperoxidase family enzyme|nr:hypothetical protein [Coriobacteriales bacterium]